MSQSGGAQRRVASSERMRRGKRGKEQRQVTRWMARNSRGSGKEIYRRRQAV